MFSSSTTFGNKNADSSLRSMTTIKYAKTMMVLRLLVI